MTREYTVLAGRHVDLDGTVYVEGETVLSDKPLDRIYRGKFEEKGARTKLRNAKLERLMLKKGKVSRKAPVPESDPAEDDSRLANDLGKDVTENFPAAQRKDMKVYKTEDGQYNVCDADDPENPIHEGPIDKLSVSKLLAGDGEKKNVNPPADVDDGVEGNDGEEAPKKKKKKKKSKS